MLGALSALSCECGPQHHIQIAGGHSSQLCRWRIGKLRETVSSWRRTKNRREQDFPINLLLFGAILFVLRDSHPPRLMRLASILSVFPLFCLVLYLSIRLETYLATDEISLLRDCFGIV
jgi:hypothetical protein